MKRGEKEEKSRVRLGGLGGFFPNRPFCPAFTSSPLLLRFSYILVLPVCPIPFPTSPHIPSFFFSFIHSLKPRGCHEVRFFLNFFSSFFFWLLFLKTRGVFKELFCYQLKEAVNVERCWRCCMLAMLEEKEEKKEKESESKFPKSNDVIWKWLESLDDIIVIISPLNLISRKNEMRKFDMWRWGKKRRKKKRKKKWN